MDDKQPKTNDHRDIFVDNIGPDVLPVNTTVVNSLTVGDRVICSVELLNELPRDGSGPEGQYPNTRVCRIKEIRERTDYHGTFHEIVFEVEENG